MEYSNVTNIHYMFSNAINFNKNIGNVDTSKVTNMSYIINWDTSNVTNM
jgi:surface protein